MKKSLKYHILCIILFVGIHVTGQNSVSSALPQITATQAGMVDFKVYSSLSADDMNGTNDVSDKLQQAINYARDQFKSLFIPSGTYLLSKPIDCISTNQNNHKGQGAIVIVGSQKARPLFKLMDYSSAFQGSGLPSQANGPRPLFGIRKVDFPSKNSDWLFYCGMRSIDIDLGIGNPGAIGISWASAQNCFLEEITVKAYDCFAGVAGLPGANGLTADVEVQGGRYGFYLTLQSDNITLWEQASVTTVVGCRLYNQTENSMKINGFAGVTLVGMDIKKQNGTALWLRGSGNPNECPLSLIDSKIEFVENSTGNRAIDNSNRSTVGLINVYTQNCSNICFNNNTENFLAVGATTDWTRIARYNYVAKSGKNSIGRHYVDGVLSNTDIVSQDKSTPPENLISRHIWPTTPSFEDDDVVLITNSGGNHRLNIQNAIDNNKKVMLAAGTYTLDGPIVLKKSTILFGSPGYRVFLTNQSSWAPTNHVWMIDTDDAPDATTYLFDISTDAPMTNYWGAVRWRAGKNSVVRHIANNRVWGGREKNIKRVYFTGSGGGRWYNYTDHHNIDDAQTPPVDPNLRADPNHRKVVVEGTSQPLTFYGLNLERGGGYKGIVSSFPMAEIKNSSNVRIFGAKTETYQPYALINNCSNVFLTNIDDWCIHNKNLSAQHYIEIQGVNSSNIEVMNAQWNLPPNNTYKIVKDPWSDNTPNRTEFMGLYKVGNVDFEIFTVDPISTSIKETIQLNKPKCLVYPNPSSDGQFFIKSDSDIKSISISDITGKLILNKEIDSVISQFQLQNQGVYLLKAGLDVSKLIYQK